MKVTVYGTGYVGLVTGACLADAGHQVLCVDVLQNKIDALKNGEIPIYEPGLDVVVRQAASNGLLRFSTDMDDAVSHGIVQFIAVGTPPDEDGSADLQYVLQVARTIAQRMVGYKLIVNKSTVPVGTGDLVAKELRHVLKARGVNFDFDIASNPEFLKEGAAIQDFMKPDRIVIGCSSVDAERLLRELYYPFNRNHDRIIVMDVRSAELTKYAANAMLATKISFINEMAALAEKVGADIEKVRAGIGSDPRIGHHFIYPGCGYGGSCFPKDVKALINMSEKAGENASLIRAVEAVNMEQKRRLVGHIDRYFNGNLNGKVLAVWGLAFKPNTDDMREAPSTEIIAELISKGASIRAYDPASLDNARRLYSGSESIVFFTSKEAALTGADALVICTEWKNFRVPDFDLLKKALRFRVIFDGRNLYDPDAMQEAGLDYFAVGRGLSVEKHCSV
jgi:UDPglucose 6-dehydrogenase